MYTRDDPRSTLQATATSAAPATDGVSGIAAPEYFDFSILKPDQETQAGTRTWITRSQNLVLAYSEPAVGDPLSRGTFTFEHVLLLVQDTSAAVIASGAASTTVQGQALVAIPPGTSEITATGEGGLVHLVHPDEPGWSQQARNAGAYQQPHPRVRPLQPWPAPHGGGHMRVYHLADVPQDPTRFGRIFRTRSFMVNFLAPNDGPRDPAKLSPHHHDDFEQISLAVSGQFAHHIRTPWISDSRAWREDEHHTVASPSVTVIPPPTVHTSAAIGSGRNQLIDIFAPPRTDFSAQPGWVLNAEEYPQP